MRQGEIGLRAHFDQARRRALEFVDLKAVGAAVQQMRFGGGGGDDLHGTVVKRIDQQDESLGFIARRPAPITGMRSTITV